MWPHPQWGAQDSEAPSSSSPGRGRYVPYSRESPEGLLEECELAFLLVWNLVRATTASTISKNNPDFPRTQDNFRWYVTQEK